MTTKVCVVYSKNQKVRRRLIKCGSDDHYEFHKNIHQNEGWLEIPLEIYEKFATPYDIDNYISGKIGPKKSDRCAVICPINGTCLHIIHADPEIDIHSDGEIIIHDTINVGDKL